MSVCAAADGLHNHRSSLFLLQLLLVLGALNVLDCLDRKGQSIRRLRRRAGQPETPSAPKTPPQNCSKINDGSCLYTMQFTNSVKVFAVRGIIQSTAHICRKFWELIVFFFFPCFCFLGCFTIYQLIIFFLMLLTALIEAQGLLPIQRRKGLGRKFSLQSEGLGSVPRL